MSLGVCAAASTRAEVAGYVHVYVSCVALRVWLRPGRKWCDALGFSEFLSALLRPHSGRGGFSEFSKRTFTNPFRALSRIKIKSCTCRCHPRGPAHPLVCGEPPLLSANALRAQALCCSFCCAPCAPTSANGDARSAAGRRLWYPTERVGRRRGPRGRR